MKRFNYLLIRAAFALLISSCGSQQSLEPAVTGEPAIDPQQAGEIHNAVLLDFVEWNDVQSNEKINPDLLVTSIASVFDEYGIAVSEDEIRYYVQASIDCAKEVEERTGIDMSEFGALTVQDIERLFQDIAAYCPVEGFDVRSFASIAKPGKSKEFIRLVSASDVPAVVIQSMDIYLHSFDFWNEYICYTLPWNFWLWPEREQCEAMNPPAGPEEAPNKNACRQILSQAIIDLVGGLYGGLLGPIGGMVGSTTFSTLYKLDLAMTPVGQ